MKRLALLMTLALVGCPWFQEEAAAPPPASPLPPSPPASPTPAVSLPAHHPTSRPASRPAGGPPLLVDLTPNLTAEHDGVKVTLERLRLQPCTAEALGQEPGDLSDQVADGVYFLSLTLAISREGTGFFDLEGLEGELSVKAIALLHGVTPVVVPAGFVERAGERAEAVYLWRPILPPPATKTPLGVRVLLTPDMADDLEFEFELPLESR